MRSTWLLRLGAALLAIGLLGTACAGDDTNGGDAATTATETPTDEMTEHGLELPSVDTPVAGLTQTLTAALVEHEYLAGIAVAMGVQRGLDSPEFTAAAEALDQNSQDLGGAIASIYEDAAGKQFLRLWRSHIGFFVDYTKARSSGDDAAARKAQKGLDSYRGDFGAFIDGATEGALPKDAVAGALKPHVDSTFTAIDAVLDLEKGNPFLLLKDAAGHLPGIATALATGIGSQQDLDGAADTPASSLQQTLTAGLVEHEYLAGIAVTMGVQNGLDSPEFTAAAEALDQNSQDIAGAIGSIYGDAGGKQFLKLWRSHIGFFVDYTAARASGDDAAAKKAMKNLDGYRADFGAFIEGATEGALPKDAVVGALKPHVDATVRAIDGVLGLEMGNPFILLKEAASHMPGIATALATAIVGQFPDKFAG